MGSTYKEIPHCAWLCLWGYGHEQSTLRGFSRESTTRHVAKSREEASLLGIQTAFLSHSHLDHELAIGLQNLLVEEGWSVYIDWQDHSLPSSPNGHTAAFIRLKIKVLDWFLFLVTENSKNSKWCPWELGFADGVKDNSRVLVIPTSDAYGKTHGNEYLEIYRRLDVGSSPSRSGYAVFKPSATNGVWIENLKF